MQTIKVLTGNLNKFKEIQAVIPDVEIYELDLPEVQSIDPNEIIEQKLIEGQKHLKGPFMIEDTCLIINGMNGLPGLLVKFFLKTVGVEGIYKMAQVFEDMSALAIATIGYVDENNANHIFRGELKGNIVSPRGEDGFGWDSIFEIESLGKTMAEISPEEKLKVSMRVLALKQLQEHLA
jgi:inosine triphosphate pyrophosphatase